MAYTCGMDIHACFLKGLYDRSEGGKVTREEFNNACSLFIQKHFKSPEEFWDATTELCGILGLHFNCLMDEVEAKQRAAE